MAKVQLTESTLRKLKAGRERMWDLATPGLYVICGAKGVVFYCKADGVERKIGSAKDWSLAEAQAECRNIRVSGDIRGHRIPTLNEAFADFDKLRLSKRRPKTARDYRRLMEIHVLPRWGKRPVHQLGRRDVQRL